MHKSLSIEIRGLARSLLVSALLCLLAGILVYLTPLKETLLPSLGNIILVASVFWGACFVSRLRGSKGLVRGSTIGLLFFIIMLMATFLFDPGLISFRNFLNTLLLCIVSGALGGILGIGLSDSAL